MKILRLLEVARAAGTLALALLLGGTAHAENSAPWPELPLPPHAKLEWVGQDMKVNGIPMRVMHFESTASRSEIVAYYTAHWSEGYPGKPSVQPLGEATVVGQALGPYYMTVKVTDHSNNASEGYISVSQIVGNRVERHAGGLPLMPGALVMTVVESNDPGKHCRQVVVAQDASVDSSQQFYQAALEGAGWKLVQTTAPDAPAARTGRLDVYHRDLSELSITVTPARGGRGSTLVANWVTKGTGLPSE